MARGSGRQPGKPVADMTAPADLTPAELEVWREVIDGTPADWWQQRHRATLAMYCAHVVTWRLLQVRIRQAEDELRQPEAVGVNLEWLTDLCALREREARAALSLATKMRLTHQASRSRTNDRDGPGGKLTPPWEQPEDEAAE